ncbi:MAG: tRNA (adenosine(37)-N6)-threonylcarbamoyltransferase complex dimerization subunit type 1 TsaB [Dysgonomonas sp.]
MSCILNIDTSTEICSVAIADNQNILFNQVETKGPSHASILGVFVDEAVKYIQNEGKKLDAVAISCGPGSYTGLRIGVSEAKGICFGLDIPLIAIHTPLIMASGVLNSIQHEENVLLCPMIDARRMEVYAAIYDQKLNTIRKISADIVSNETYSDILANNKILFFGNGAKKCMPEINNENAIFIDNISPLATDMATLSQKAFDEHRFEDIAYFEPFYLKEFITTTQKNKLF